MAGDELEPIEALRQSNREWMRAAEMTAAAAAALESALRGEPPREADTDKLEVSTSAEGVPPSAGPATSQHGVARDTQAAPVLRGLQRISSVNGRVLVGAGVVAAVLAVSLWRSGPEEPPPARASLFVPPAVASQAALPGPPSARATTSGTRKPGRVASLIPVRVDVPEIEVSGHIVPLGLNGDGTLQVPSRYSDVGWYRGGPVPGEPGPAVLVGHLESETGPAVFYRLEKARPGTFVNVHRVDGTYVRFRVERVARFSTGRFPTHAVYGATREPTLRLVTCLGRFDRSAGHHRDNLVVFARFVGAESP